eukprot:TRINITY_DN41535_c0_g1_i1.p1 TRINITY_DN41535_c0_g1~~TRINITY_DN41535_c0_g1_i1.p1  ORF type:complete len:159 (-),score=34.66 TRINITY_DN41535_c0_g1_i1:68-544(-)
MAFSRADRDQYHLTGSDNPTAPDYVKGPPARSQRDAARAAREASAGAKQPLPKVPLRTEKPRYRKSTMKKELFTVDGALILGDSQSAGCADHPLAKFERQAPLKPTGRFRADDGQLTKITGLQYNKEESMAERRLAAKGNSYNQEANRGGGYNIISGN